jgi:cytochrome c-type biogenesis protein CcmH
MIRVLFLLLPMAVWAVEPGERLADPALETRARAISAELRCVVCQNESIDESRADLARDIRRLVRERLLAGETDSAVTRAVVDRYGAFVLLRPPVQPATWLLWFGPFILLLIAGAAVALWLRRRPAAPPPEPLTEAEQARFDTLNRDDRR